MTDYTRKDYERMLNKRPLVTISKQRKQVYEIIEIIFGLGIAGAFVWASMYIK